MKLTAIVEKLHLAVSCAGKGLDQEVTGAYAGDLLSDVIANSRAGSVWVTMQVHVNIVAVAVLKDLPAIILVNGRMPAEDTLKKAAEEKIAILTSGLPAYETSGGLSRLGIGSAG